MTPSMDRIWCPAALRCGVAHANAKVPLASAEVIPAPADDALPEIQVNMEAVVDEDDYAGGARLARVRPLPLMMFEHAYALTANA